MSLYRPFIRGTKGRLRKYIFFLNNGKIWIIICLLYDLIAKSSELLCVALIKETALMSENKTRLSVNQD